MERASKEFLKVLEHGHFWKAFTPKLMVRVTCERCGAGYSLTAEEWDEVIPFDCACGQHLHVEEQMSVVDLRFA